MDNNGRNFFEVSLGWLILISKSFFSGNRQRRKMKRGTFERRRLTVSSNYIDLYIIFTNNKWKVNKQSNVVMHSVCNIGLNDQIRNTIFQEVIRE
jgi:hypothetical protein